MKTIFKIIGGVLLSLSVFAQNNAIILNGGFIIINGGTSTNPAYLVINQDQPTGIIRPGGGHIHSENQYNYVVWVTSTTTGSYVVPFGVGGTAADYIPLGFNKTNAANITLTVSTYSTVAANTPMPGASTSNGGAVAAVSAIPQSADAIDRYWDIKTNAAVNADITFSYRGIENTIAGGGPCATDTIKAQNWNGTSWNPLKGPGNPGVTTGIGVVGPIPAWTTYGQFVLARSPLTPTITTSSSVLNCTNTSISATVNASGGLGPYSYTWMPAGGNSSVATISSPGNYTLTISGTNGCSTNSVLSITQNTTTPNVTAGPNQTITCSSSSVNITASSSPSTGVSINWLGGVCGPTNSFTTQACAPGNYTIEVTDNSNGCVGTSVVSVAADSNVPNVTATSGTITCSNPTTQVVATTTSSPVSYAWSGTGIIGPNNTPTIVVNQGNTYTLVVTNTSNGCSSTITAVVPSDTNTPTVNLSANSVTLSCSSPSIQIDATSSASNYSWTTSGGNIIGPTNTPTLVAGSAGTYTLTVTGSNGCTAAVTATVFGNSNAPQVTLSANSATLTCTNTSVTINATVPATLTNASYSWSPSSGISSGANSSTATFTASGSYTLIVIDNNNGCSTSTLVNIAADQNPPAVSLSASNPSISCTNGTVDISVTPVNSTDTYLWNGSGAFTGQGTATITTTNSGTYQVVVTNTLNGCSTTQSIDIGFDNNFTVSIMGNTLICQGDTIKLNASGATDYNWIDIAGNTYTTSNIDIVATSNTQFTLTASTGACNTTTIIGVNVSPQISISVTAIPNNSISLGDEVVLNATGANAYTWTPITGLDNPNSASPKASPYTTTDYCVLGINSNGVCKDTACIRIYLDTRCPEIFIPNVFSPNGDGNNDELVIYGTKCVKEFKLVIFDRWGEKVFETDDVNAKWDGTYNGKDMNGSTFVYYVKGLYKDDRPIDLKGNVTIVK